MNTDVSVADATSAIDLDALAVRLRNARLRLGWSQRTAATRSGIPQPTIARLELARAIREPVSVISALADAYAVRLDHLLYGSQVAARVLAAARGAVTTAAADSAAAAAVTLLEFDEALDAVIADLRQERRTPAVQVPTVGTALQRARALAAAVRQTLGLGVAPIADVPSLLTELTGVDVGSADLGAASGVCMVDPERDTAVVLANSSDSRERQRFSYAHELAHLLFGDGAHVDGLASGRSEKERRSDEFARELLIPTEALRSWLAATESVTARAQVSERVLARAARHFGVSPEAARIAFDRAGLLPAAIGELPSARVLAARYGWARQYDAEAALAARAVQPQRVVERATRAYHAGRLGVTALAALTGADTAELTEALAEADVAPTPTPVRADIDDLLARAALAE